MTDISQNVNDSDDTVISSKPQSDESSSISSSSKKKKKTKQNKKIKSDIQSSDQPHKKQEEQAQEHGSTRQEGVDQPSLLNSQADGHMVASATISPAQLQRDRLQNMRLEALYEDRDVIVINKPFDLRIDGNHEFTVEKMVNSQFPQMLKPELREEGRTRKRSNSRLLTYGNDGYQTPKRKLKFAHQLDFATSGALCLAFTKQSCAAVTHCFQSRTASKIYLALLLGHVKQHHQRIVTYIGPDFSDLRGFKMFQYGSKEEMEKKVQEITKEHSKATSGKAASKMKVSVAKEAISEIKVISYGKYRGKDVTKVMMKLCTGRRHQLRLHAVHIGHPIVGDVTYGGDSQKDAPRMMLHSYFLYLPVKDDYLLDTRHGASHGSSHRSKGAGAAAAAARRRTTREIVVRAPDPFRQDVFTVEQTIIPDPESDVFFHTSST